ncbi:MAG TPA: futalosine hydrolase [Chitinophagaceae bacterium]|jgi:futalosine hydrolase|nr:futalosine hydrolase [Chitinophagaceae bacterium]
MGKNILVVAATAKEIAPFIDLTRTGGLNNIDILISGIGLTASTYHLAKQLTLKKYDLVIQAGVAGSFDLRIPLGAVVAVKQDAIADQSVVELQKLKTLFDLKLVPQDQYPYKKGWLINPNKDIFKKIKLKIVRGISVNQISTSKQMIKFYRDAFDPVTESMEGAALHYVCLMEKTPFFQIRSISNYIGERNKQKWNMMDSIINLNKSLKSLVTSLK